MTMGIIWTCRGTGGAAGVIAPAATAAIFIVSKKSVYGHGDGRCQRFTSCACSSLDKRAETVASRTALG
jgi:hypothetical protein